MKNTIQIAILCIYFIASCFIIGENKWAREDNSTEENFAEKIFSLLTISVCDYAEGTNELPFFFKDPMDDKSIQLDYYPCFVLFGYISRHDCFYSSDKIKDPFLYIFSPPPLNPTICMYSA